MPRFFNHDGTIPQEVIKAWNSEADRMRASFGATDAAAQLALAQSANIVSVGTLGAEVSLPPALH